MLYRGEIVADGSLKYAQNYRATNPKQIMRNIVARLKASSLEFATIYILNDEGQIWVYNVRQVPGGVFRAQLVSKPTQFLPENKRNRCFAGNMMIKEVI